MVRVGVVDHPSKSKWNMYHEIQNPKTRYRLIDHDKLNKYLNIETHEELAKIHQGWVDSQLNKKSRRQEHFSKSIAVGSKVFVDQVRHTLSAQARRRCSRLALIKARVCQSRLSTLMKKNLMPL